MATGSHEYERIFLSNMGKNLFRTYTQVIGLVMEKGKASAEYQSGEDDVSVLFRLGDCGTKLFIHKTIKRVGTLSPTEKFFELSLA